MDLGIYTLYCITSIIIISIIIVGIQIAVRPYHKDILLHLRIFLMVLLQYRLRGGQRYLQLFTIDSKLTDSCYLSAITLLN